MHRAAAFERAHPVRMTSRSSCLQVACESRVSSASRVNCSSAMKRCWRSSFIRCSSMMSCWTFSLSGAERIDNINELLRAEPLQHTIFTYC